MVGGRGAQPSPGEWVARATTEASGRQDKGRGMASVSQALESSLWNISKTRERELNDDPPDPPQAPAWTH